MNPDAKQTEIGKLNFLCALGSLEGDFLHKAITAPATGPHFFNYGAVDRPVRAAIVGTGNEGCQAMIEQSSPSALEYIGYFDIRPTQRQRARKTFEKVYGPEQGKKVKEYADWAELLADPDVEAVVVATPLWTHKRFSVEAMEAGKHVLCEKLMAHSVAEGKEMVRASEKAGKVLSIGHQRHYSPLYHLALRVVESGLLGDVRHVRALWHRNNTWTLSDPHRPDQPTPGDPDWGVSGDSWCPILPKEDQSAPYSQAGYKSLEELVRWRLYDRTGGGLMAELGSHQLDACSLFLGKVHPEKVLATGGKHFFQDARECEDHVYCMYQMPKGVTLMYSSINSNALEGYGEVVMGTKGTLLVMNERDVMLFKEREPGDMSTPEETYIQVVRNKKTDKLELASTPSTAVSPEAALAKTAYERSVYFTPPGAKASTVNRGYYTEIEAFAYAIRNPDYQVRCSGRVALADAVMALSANVSMRAKQPIVFRDSWYDPASDEAPESASSALATR